MQAVRRLHRRSARTAEQRFLVEGPQAVREALAAGLLELYTTDPQGELAERARLGGTPVVHVTETVLGALAETVSPQGLVGVAAVPGTTLGEALGGSPRLVVVLHEVTDPGNAGSVIRTADAAGADAVVLTAGSVDAYGGKCVRATAGSLWHLPVVVGPTLAETVTALRAARLQVLATSGAGEDDLEVLAAAGPLADPTGWLFGTEAHGLPDSALLDADRRVRIPIRGRAESLNLAAAAAICLYATARAQSVLY